MPDNDIAAVILIGTDGVPYSASGGVTVTDSGQFVPTTDSASPVMGLYELAPTTLANNDVGVVAVTANRVLKAALSAADGSAITTLPVSLAATVAVTQSGTWDEVGINDSGNSITVDNGGTFAVQAAGDVAHDSPDSGGGAPVKIGGYAASSASAPTAVAAGDRVNAWYGLNGQAIVGYGSSGTGGDGVNGGFFTDAAGTARPVVVGVWNGTAYDRLRGTLADGLTVNLGANNDVTVASLPLPTGASTLAEQQTQTTALQLIDDASVVLGTATYTEASSSGRAIAAVRRDADTTLVNTTNEWGPLQMDANGRLKVEIFDGADSHSVDWNGTQPVTGSGTATGALRVELPTNGTGTLATLTTLTTLTGGGIAHDSADSGNPHKVGMKAIDIGTQPTAVTANDRTDWYANRNGVPWMLGGSPAVLTKQLNVTDADGAQTDVALITVSAGTAIVVTAFQAMCDGANTVDVAYRVGFGTANTPAADAAGIISSHPGVKAGSGVVIGNGGGVIGMGASNEDLRVTCEDPVTGAIDFIITYFTVLIG